jgi:predicted DNA-binding WGR domain protein
MSEKPKRLVTQKTLVRFGPVGTGGRNVAKEHANPKAAQAEADKLISEKKSKGYVTYSPHRVTPKMAEPMKKAARKNAAPKKAEPKRTSSGQ